MSVSLEWHGPEVEARLTEAGGDGIGKAAEHLLETSRQVVPLEEGTLERSGVAAHEGTKAVVAYDTVYAVYQHERLDLRHDNGRTAKYLETPAHEQADAMVELVAAEIRRALGA